MGLSCECRRPGESVQIDLLTHSLAGRPAIHRRRHGHGQAGGLAELRGRRSARLAADEEGGGEGEGDGDHDEADEPDEPDAIVSSWQTIAQRPSKQDLHNNAGA